jgi:hypothetical protein
MSTSDNFWGTLVPPAPKNSTSAPVSTKSAPEDSNFWGPLQNASPVAPAASTSAGSKT